jgi:hypothetical protein
VRLVAAHRAYCDWPFIDLVAFGFFAFFGFFLCSDCGGEYDDACVLLACAKTAGLDAASTAAAIATVTADVSFFMRLSPCRKVRAVLMTGYRSDSVWNYKIPRPSRGAFLRHYAAHMVFSNNLTRRRWQADFF